MMKRARDLGYSVVLLFVGISDVTINLRRIRGPVEKGGHDVSEEDQLRRYPRSMENLRLAFELADEAIVFDNSAASHVKVAVKDREGHAVRAVAGVGDLFTGDQVGAGWLPC